MRPPGALATCWPRRAIAARSARADIEAAAVLLMGALQSQRLYRGEFPDGWEERIVDTVLGAMLR